MKMFRPVLILVPIALLVACISPPGSQERPPETTLTSSIPTTSSIITSSTISPTTSIIPACWMNYDCGVIQEEWICIGGDLYRKKTIPICKNPGDKRATCIETIHQDLIDRCEEDEKCVEGNKSCNPKRGE